MVENPVNKWQKLPAVVRSFVKAVAGYHLEP